jgi:hypothetical protein
MRRVSHKHAFMTAGGLALFALAATLPTLVEIQIKENVRASVVVDTYKVWHKKRRPVWKTFRRPTPSRRRCPRHGGGLMRGGHKGLAIT